MNDTALRDLVIVGGGTAGLTAALMGAGLGAQVTLVERDRTGGDCLWTGCVPSKGLLEAANLVHRMRHADALGLDPVEAAVDLGSILGHVRKAQAHIEPHDSPERLRSLGVEVVADHAVFTGPRTLRCTESRRTLSGRIVLIATGSSPVIPPLPGLREAEPLTTDTIWGLDTLPRKLAILGGGPVGCELGQAFARLGAEVTLIEAGDRLLPAEDPEASDLIADQLRSDGVDVRIGTRGRSVERSAEGWSLNLDTAAGAVTFDRILVATGRSARTQDLSLDVAGVATNERGAVLTNRRMRTSARGVYAAGDVTGILPFTHAAAYQAGIATTNGLLLTRRRAAYRSLPWVTFTDPEIARVGVTEAQARARWGARAVVAGVDYDHVDRAVVSGRTTGFAKLVGDPSGRLVGATVAAPAGGEVIGEFAGAVSRGAKLGDVYRTVHPYPTYALGAVSAGARHLQATLLGERTRRLTRPLFGVLRDVTAISL